MQAIKRVYHHRVVALPLLLLLFDILNVQTFALEALLLANNHPAVVVFIIIITMMMMIKLRVDIIWGKDIQTLLPMACTTKM
jgi:hypothetical protein